jgi:hypothetical protein
MYEKSKLKAKNFITIGFKTNNSIDKVSEIKPKEFNNPFTRVLCKNMSKNK